MREKSLSPNHCIPYQPQHPYLADRLAGNTGREPATLGPRAATSAGAHQRYSGDLSSATGRRAPLPLRRDGRRPAAAADASAACAAGRERSDPMRSDASKRSSDS